jgi:hypothetical protein
MRRTQPQPTMPLTDEIPEFIEESPAYEEGWSAYQREIDRVDNPYDAERESDAFRDWMRGWDDALDEAQQEVER